jgi:regulator of sigma E protease
MLDFVFSILAFIVAISLLVAVHEYGHFWVARKLGFKVLRFSIGFGRPLVSWQGNGIGMPVSLATRRDRWPLLAWLARDGGREPVEFCISAIPLGGYVKMLDEREGPVGADEVDRAFNRRPPWARIAVLFAGPGFNFLFAVIAYWIMFMSGVPGMRPYIEGVDPGSAVAEAGLGHGDVIQSVGGRDTPTWESAIVRILDELLEDGRIELTAIADNGERKAIALDLRGREGELTEPDALFDGLGIRIGPRVVPLIGTVSDGQPAAAAGLREGDLVTAIDGEPVTYWDDLVTRIRARPGRDIELEIERGGERLVLPVEVASISDGDETIGQIGAGAAPLSPALIERIRVVERHGPFAALTQGVSKTWETSVLTVRMIGRMLTGDVSIRSASGPIMIAAYAGDYAQAGVIAFLSFLSLISISLGIMNLMPVPILDGGQIVMCLVEAVKGRPLSMRTALIGQQVGLAMLIALMGFVFYNDITRMLGL